MSNVDRALELVMRRFPEAVLQREWEQVGFTTERRLIWPNRSEAAGEEEDRACASVLRALGE